MVETPLSEISSSAILDPLSLAALTEEQIESRLDDKYEIGSEDISPSIVLIEKPTELPKISEEITVKRSASGFLLLADSGLDLVSSLHFLLDLYSHWLSNSPDNVPISLLSTTVESVKI